MKQALTFDCYGTLLDTSPLYHFIGEVAASNSLPREQAVRIFSAYEDRLMYGEAFLPYDKLISEILLYCDMELNTDVFAPQYNEVLNIHRAFSPFPEVLDALERLRAKGYALAVMSNSTRQLMNCHLEKMDHMFTDSLVAEEVKCYKPDLSFFRLAKKKFGIQKNSHCHIAAGYWWDIVPARKMGWNRIWVNRNHLHAGRNSEQPYTMISTLAELPQL